MTGTVNQSENVDSSLDVLCVLTGGFHVRFAELTHTVCIIQFEAAEDVIAVPRVEKTVASDYDLETLWE